MEPEDPRKHPGKARGRPELLAPAGDPLALRAAIASGADAVYLGMARFNARGRAERFRGVTLEASVRAAHERGVKVYVTLNTLLHDDELPPAVELAFEAHDAGADAAIVQDMGLAAALRDRLPGFPVHGSTQMTVHQPDQAAEVVSRFGLRRVIVARECSVEEIERLADRIRPLGADVEVFVHGALCFAYSGQCLMSNFAGRRSANRGICAQNCRFDFSTGPVERTAPGQARGFVPLPVFDPSRSTQILSMKDLAAFESVAALADRGVASFKIEGRLKGPDYVAEVTRLYRAALDAWETDAPFSVDEARRAAGRVYSRGFTNGYLAGRRGPEMRGDKRSLEGEPDLVVLSANRKTGLVVLEPREGHAIRAGQGYRYAHDRYRGGFRVIGSDAGRDGRTVARVRFGAEASGRRHRRGASGRKRPPPPLPAGLACYLNDDPALSAQVGALVRTAEIPAGPAPALLRIRLEGGPGEPLRAIAVASDGRGVDAETPEALEPARGRPLDREILEEHLGRFGGTRFRLESLDASGVAPRVFLRFPLLHALRRALVLKLEAAGTERALSLRRSRRFDVHENAPPGPVHRPTRLAVSVGSPRAGEEALLAGASCVLVESLGLPGGHERQVEAWRLFLSRTRDIWVKLPSIVHDPSIDSRALEVLQREAPEAGVIAGHMGQIALARRAGMRVAADFHLNASNALTLGVLRDAGACRATLSLELEAREAARVADFAGAGIEVEVVVGGAVFSMLTRQDFGLEEGASFAAVSEHGHAYRFEAGGGITTLYEAREVVGAGALHVLAGKVDVVRLDLAHQGPEAVREIAGAYASVLEHMAAPVAAPAEVSAAVARAVGVHSRRSPSGTFAGHLLRGARTLDSSEE